MHVPRTVYPAIVAGATFGGIRIFAATGGGLGTGTLLLGLLPVAISTAWGVSLLLSGSLSRHLVTAVLTILATAASTPGFGIATAAYVLSGLAVGWGLGYRLGFDRVLGVGLLPMAIAVALALAPVAADDLVREYGQDLTEALRRSLPAGGDEAARQALVAEYERMVARTTRVLSQVWPAVVLAGLMAQIGLVLVLVRSLAMLVAKELPLRSWIPFARWEVPFYWVWVLVSGLIMILSRVGSLPHVGINLVVVAAIMFSVQGLAVQVNLLGRVFPPWVRVLFWTMAAFCFAPLLLLGSALLGLGDQWLNLRKRPPATPAG